MTIGLLSSRGVAFRDVHPWHDTWEGPVLNAEDSPRLPNYRTPRYYVRASHLFFVEVETPQTKERTP